MTILAAAFFLCQDPQVIKIDLKADPMALSFENSKKTGAMYMPSAAPLSDAKPAEIKKLPTANGKWQFGSVSLGNGSKRAFLIALDVTETDAKLYIDFNQTGDLTDDKPADWKRLGGNKPGELPSYQGTNLFDVSYQSKGKAWKSPYGLNFYWSPGRAALNYFRSTLLTGKAKLGDEEVDVRLIENANDGCFDMRYDLAPADTVFLKPIYLVFGRAQKDARGTFELNDTNYLPTISPDGKSVVLTPSFKSVKPPTRPPVQQKELLQPGAVAPDFTVEAYTGGPAKLSDYKGKVVVLKFWASWCGPCKASMPHFEELYRKTKPQGVELLAVCVSDEKPAYEAFVAANKSKYSYPFFYDVAGRTQGQSISGRLYNVTGIPTVFVIGRDGKIAASIVGYSEGDHRVDDALAKLGVKVK